MNFDENKKYKPVSELDGLKNISKDNGEIVSISLCARNISNQLDYIVELVNTDIDNDLKYSFIADVAERIKKDCDLILKCLNIGLEEGRK